MASLLYRGRLRYDIEDKVGVCIIDSITHCHTKIFQNRRKSRNVASFLYRGRTELMNLSSIVFHAVLLKMDTAILKSFKIGENLEMWLRFYIEGGQNWRIYHR